MVSQRDEDKAGGGGADTEIAQEECNGRLGPVDKRGKKQVVGDGKRDTWDKNLRKG